METDDLISLPASSSFGSGSEDGELHSSNCKPGEAISLPINSEAKEDELNGEVPENEGDVVNEDSKPLLANDNDKDLVDSTTIFPVSVESTEATGVKENINCFSCTLHTENGFTVQDGSPLNNHKRDGSPISSHGIDGTPIASVKRPRVTVDEQQSSVHVVYNALTRDSKQKLEKLLQQWSEWHTRHYSSCYDSNEVLESGEETYFPALHVGLDKPSAVSFWMDSQTRNLPGNEFIPLDGNSVPLYDRGYSCGLTSTDGLSNLEGGMELVDASRCFNCGSYNHSLKECPKPRDNVAVNNARKQHKTKRNQNASSRNPTRYYQNSPGGKYDGLRPGVLDSETQQLLGLGELDPPPWLNRMREIGYPPGYLEDEDQPSGITIFADEESKEETEDGEILDADYPRPPKKMSVEFPGINAPIPENADERRWITGPSSSNLSRNRSHRRYNHSSEPTSKGHYNEQRWSTDYRDDGPPGCDPGTSPLISSYSPRYGDYDSSYTSHSPRGNISIPRSPSFGRSMSDRGRRSPLVHESSSNHDSYSSLHCSPPNRLLSPQNYGSDRWENRDNDHRKNFTPDSKGKHDSHHHHRRR